MTGTFGNYQLLAEIGHGSSARVYTAKSGSGPAVALKVFDLGKSEDSLAAVLRFFEKELGVVRSLDHPNIVKYLDAGTVGDTPYVAMELFGAGTLEERLRRSSFLNVDDVTAVLEPLADAIDYAHGRRLLHRDIKPSNILFTDSGRPVLSDFGIAHVLPSRESTIGPGFETIFGTAEYMAPEVMQEAPPSPASDIYSLGMTVYFALSGKFPTDGGTPFTRSRARVEGHLVPLMQRNPAVSAPVSHAVMTAIATEPGSRYKSARAFAAALRVSASVAPEGWHPPPEPVQESAPRRERAPGPQSTPKAEVASDAPRKKSWLDYWRYVVVPIVIAIVSAIASWLSRKN